ncbi:galactosylceramide sulfotransferase-like isoform X2 [Montipora foliosa]|uniref:galactosylceramide sulfotransferase-like isoform X2 n=1 Tax=Montipora foliosa TaxID=591990 RepID=UPI0035F1797C
MGRSTRTYVRKALPSDGQPYESSTDLSWQQESDDDDREFEELLRGAKEHNEYEGNEELDDQKQTQETSTEDDAFAYDELRCQPHNNVAFLKTHKTGSSTLTNILNRYADLRELVTALPRQGLYRFGWPGYFNWNNVDLWRLNGEPANVLCNHARYRRRAMDVIMHSNTKYITILRDPVYQFESTFHYMELYRYFELTNYSSPMEIFLTKPREYLVNLTRALKTFPESMHLVRNGMFFDLGLSPGLQDDENGIRKAIQKIESEFSLVLIMEYFDESLVLLKREFCWDLDDVIYVKQNQRKPGNNSSTTVLSTQLKERIRDWNRADVLLYEHFNKTFWTKIKQHGPDFFKDLAELKRKNEEMKRDCVSPEEVTEIAFRLTGEIRAFKLNKRVSTFNRYLCQKMLTNEIQYINYFRSKLHPTSEYQRHLRSLGRARPLTKGWDSVIAERIRAHRVQMYGHVQPQFFPLRKQVLPQSGASLQNRSLLATAPDFR